MKKNIILTTIFNSKMYNSDNESELDFIRNKYNLSYEEGVEKLEDYNWGEDEIDLVNEQKVDYYLWDFWHTTSYLKDNKHWIVWNIYIDNINNEVIFNNWVIFEDWESEYIEFDTDMEKLYYDTYKELFEAQAVNISETKNFIEVDFIENNWDGSPAEWSDSNKADYVLKILWQNGNYYGFWEYDEK